jgi:hypothetical protein
MQSCSNTYEHLALGLLLTPFLSPPSTHDSHVGTGTELETPTPAHTPASASVVVVAVAIVSVVVVAAAAVLVTKRTASDTAGASGANPAADVFEPVRPSHRYSTDGGV